MPELPAKPVAPRREADVMGEVRSYLATERSCLSWRNNVGTLQDANGRYVQYGLCEGSADLIACIPTLLRCPHCDAELPPIGRFVGIEVKGPTTRTTPEQEAWAGLVNRAHGVAGFAHSADDAVTLVQRARLQW